MLEDWIKEQNQLIDWERDAEVGLLTDKISSLSAKSCQSEGLSLLNLEVESTRTVLFGRTSVCLQRIDKGHIQQFFKVGDEVSLYNPKLRSADSSQDEKYVLLGLISKVINNRVEVVVDEFDDHLFEPPLRLDIRSSQKTHTTMKDALAGIARIGMNHRLVNLLFYPNECNSALLVPTHDSCSLELSDMWNPTLNGSQISAIRCALNAPAVAIIHGPPGTGKTSTLTELILQAVHRGMKLLVCAPSNIAVDTILARLADYQKSAAPAGKKRSGGKSAPERRKCAVNMVRVGHPARISSKIMKYALDSIISTDEGTDIVKDVRKDIDDLRQEMSKKGKKRAYKDEAGVSFAQIKRDQRTEMRSLMKEARQRERAVVVNILRKADIVLSTCVGAGSRLLQDLQFDMVVIDEAAQGLEAACWIPILKINSRTGGKCVLAGDHCQLPPTIKSPQAEKGGLGVTIFERIIKDARFQAVVRLLDTQYRMNRRISDWASDNMYHGAIVSHPSVAEHTLKDILGGGGKSVGVGAITDLGGAEGSGSDEDDDLSETLSALDAATLDTGSGIPLNAESAEDVYPVLLLVDTSGLGMLEDSATATISSNSTNNGKDKKSSGGSSHRNFHEAELVKEHVLSLVRSGVKPSQIGVITPYNGQLEVLRELLFPSEVSTPVVEDKNDKKTSSKVGGRVKIVNPLTDKPSVEEVATVNLEGLEIKTIDGFQGGEKECILLSLVRSNASHTVGFLGEKRRINVAVTRAKRHLAVFCDVETCSVDRFMRTLLDHMGEHGDHISAEEYQDYFAGGAGGGPGGPGGRLTRGATAAKIADKGGALLASGLVKSTLEKGDFLRVLSKLKDRTLTTGSESKNAVLTVVIPNHCESDPTEQTGLKEIINARYYCATEVLRFPSSVNSYLRMLVHECAEELQLFHRSSGEGHDRCIEVSCQEFLPDSAIPTASSAKASRAAKSNGKVIVAATLPPAPPASIAPVLPPAAALSVVGVVNHEDEIAASKTTTIALNDSESSSEESTEDVLPAPQAAKPKAKATAAPAKKAPGGSYVGAGRQSALGRLEEQHKTEMKNKDGALDEDALIEAAIQHNQRLAHLHQYRVGGTGAMPNPEKVESKQKLHNKVAEAAIARAKGAAVGSAPQGSTATPANNIGRLSSHGSTSSNIHGFGGSASSSTGAGGSDAKEKPSGSGGGGSKKKVVKKPPPNFGGGVLGKK